jgi:hypothetical protein
LGGWLAVALAATFAVTLAAEPATAVKPQAVVAASVSRNTDCSVDVAITINQRGRLPVFLEVHYWQQGTNNGDTYGYFASFDRGETVATVLEFDPADPYYGTAYEVGYTAFARNGRILESAVLDTVFVGDCL